MRNAVTLFSLVVAVLAEAPYHLPRPAPQAPLINYARTAPVPLPPPHVISHHHSHQSANGYNYQRPIRPTFIQNAPPPQPTFVAQPQPIVQSQPAPLPLFQPYPQPSSSYGVPQQISPLPALVPQPQPIHQQFALQPQLIYQPQDAPQPQPIYHPQPVPQPQAIYQHQPGPQPLPIYQPQPAPQHIYQPTSQPQPIPQIQPVFHPQPKPAQPSSSYGVPQAISPLPAVVASHPQPQQPISIQYQQGNQGYSYQQAQLPVQPSPFQNVNIGLSSYQADSAQYNSPQQEQTHRDALDETVVSRVQSIIKDNEHSSARDAGYLSLVSGVSLENAKPSVEVLSFVHNSPLSVGPSQTLQSVSQSSSSSSSLHFSQNVPSGSDGFDSFAFLPQSKAATSYGVPN